MSQSPNHLRLASHSHLRPQFNAFKFYPVPSSSSCHPSDLSITQNPGFQPSSHYLLANLFQIYWEAVGTRWPFTAGRSPSFLPALLQPAPAAIILYQHPVPRSPSSISRGGYRVVEDYPLCRRGLEAYIVACGSNRYRYLAVWVGYET